MRHQSLEPRRNDVLIVGPLDFFKTRRDESFALETGGLRLVREILAEGKGGQLRGVRVVGRVLVRQLQQLGEAGLADAVFEVDVLGQEEQLP